MTVHVVTLPDVGEGVAEAELVRWLVDVGDDVDADTPVAEVMTDKATVELYAGAAGTVSYLKGVPGDSVAVGSDLLGVETGSAPVAHASDAPPAGPPPAGPSARSADPFRTVDPFEVPSPTSEPSPRPTAAPAVRRFASDHGVDLHDLEGSGPDGRILRADVERHLAVAAPTAVPTAVPTTVPTAGPGSDQRHETPIIGLRRRIAAQVSTSASRIPHITYVDEVDVTEVESLRATLNRDHADEHSPLTPLPFIVRAVVRALAHHPELNSTFDDEHGVLTTYDRVHVGIATQTPDGLIVPVVRDAGSLDLWDLSAAITRGAAAARDGSATAASLSGSTITVTSLGPLGGLVSTPIINHPEVAIVGVNRIRVQPVWDGGSFVPRQMMNLSSSFDHRIVDGWVAATFVQRIRTSLESPSLLFIE